jgi:(p)ppGpp synthase/HD superfamily hydrolase
MKDAKVLALTAHAGQTYGNYPYAKHLQDVVDILEEVAAPSELIQAGWLHDSLEDTTLTLEEIQLEFGDTVANLVKAVTDSPGTRQERAERMYTRLRDNEPALILKLADRLANLRASKGSNPQLYKMYLKEHPTFEARLKPLSQNSITLKLWEEINLTLTDPKKIALAYPEL